MAEASVNWKNFLEYATLSDLGLRRSNNQDTARVILASDAQQWRTRGHLFMVADGMGAHAAGEMASKMACDLVPHAYQKLADRPVPEAIHQAVVEANAGIHNRGQANAEFHGMGTTTSVLLILPEGALAAHVGDSRVYRLRRHMLEQLTFDHSLVWEMKAAGQLQGGDLPNFVPKNIITRSLGPHDEVQVDLEGPYPLEEGDTFLLCSDGLTGQVTDEEIGAILGCLSPQQAARMLVDLANLRGGPDNITVIVVRANRVLPNENIASAPPPKDRPSKLASIHPGIWVSIGVCFLGAILCGLAGYWLATIVLGFLGILVGVIALGADSASDVPSASSQITERFGSGPHMTLDCRPTAQSVQSLADVQQKLREAAREERWGIDWEQLRTREHAAKGAVSEGDFAGATRQYCLAISAMMSDLRQGGSPPPNASVIA